MQITRKNTIGFKLSGEGTKTFRTFNPIANTENEVLFHEATSAELEQAMSLAQSAFPAFARTPGKERAAFLKQIAFHLDENREILIKQYVLESGLTADRGTSELNRTIFHLGAFAELIQDDSWQKMSIDLALPDRKPIPKPDLRKMHLPLGPVVVFGASNFPFAYSTIGGDAASALAAGCPVIIKSHAMHAGVGDLVAQLIVKAAIETQMPDGIFSNLNATGFEIGEALVLHPNTKAVGFTGSFGGGMALYKLGQQRAEPIPVFAEMGSVNPVIVLPEAMTESTREIAVKLADSITQSSGQFCTNPGLLFAIENEKLASFKTYLAEAINAKEPQSMLHPNIHQKYNEFRKIISDQESVSVLTDNNKTVPPNFGLPQLSAVDAKTFNQNKKLHQEVFGPHSLLVTCKDQQELLETLSGLEGQLTCSVFASEGELDQDLIFELQLKAGRIIFNGVPTGVEVSPSMNHGGPFPATTDSRFTAVGTDAIYRFVRPVTFQNFPQLLLPKNLKTE